METEINKIAQYISIWGWHLSALIFLVSSLLSIAISINIINSILFFTFIVAFGIAEYMSNKRKKEFYEDNDEE